MAEKPEGMISAYTFKPETFVNKIWFDKVISEAIDVAASTNKDGLKIEILFDPKAERSRLFIRELTESDRYELTQVR